MATIKDKSDKYKNYNYFLLNIIIYIYIYIYMSFLNLFDVTTSPERNKEEQSALINTMIQSSPYSKYGMKLLHIFILVFIIKIGVDLINKFKENNKILDIISISFNILGLILIIISYNLLPEYKICITAPRVLLFCSAIVIIYDTIIHILSKYFNSINKLSSIYNIISYSVNFIIIVLWINFLYSNYKTIKQNSD